MLDRLESMRLFTRIVELGSFTAAADDLDLPRATVTRVIRWLEAWLSQRIARVGGCCAELRFHTW